MRTSHKEIQRKINAELSKITDEELFCSSAYAAYLTDIAEAITKRYHRGIQVKTIHDTSEDAVIAKTDNRKILVNTGNYITQSMPLRRLKAESIMGLLGHEIGHMLYTNFRVSEVYFNELNAGRLYPRFTEELPQAEEEAALELLTFLREGTKAQVLSALQAAKYLLNILEDAYIEARVCDRYKGNFAAGIILNNLRFSEMIPPISEQVEKGYCDFAIFCNILNQYCRTGDVNNRDNDTGEVLERFYELIPLVDGVIYDDDMQQRCQAVNRIMLFVWDYIQEIAEAAADEQQKNPMDEAAALDTVAKQLESQIPIMTSTPNIKETPIAETGKLDKDGFIANREDCMQELQKVLEEENTRLQWMKTESFAEGTQGGVIYNHDYQGAAYGRSGDDIGRVMVSIAEEKVQEKLFRELTEEMKEEAERIELGDQHKGIKIVINRINTVDESYIAQYNQAAAPLLSISKQLQKRLQRILRNRNRGEKQTALLMGRRLEPRYLMDREGRFFSKKARPGNQKSLAVAVLVDESGSMSGQDRVTYARAAGIIIYDFCKAMDVPVLIMGHTDDGDVQLFAYTDFDSIDNRDRYRLMDMSARCGNRDGAALRYVAERLQKQAEDNKLLLIISDGQPAGSGGYIGSVAEADLRGIRKEFVNKGMMFVAAAIGADKENIERIYGDAFLDITDLTKLPILLLKRIERELRG